MNSNIAFKRNIQKKKTNLFENTHKNSNDHHLATNTGTEMSEREGLVSYSKTSILKVLLEGENMGFENGNVTNRYYKRLRMVEVANLIMAMIGMIASLIEYDLEFKGIEHWKCDVLLWFIFITTMILLFMVLIRYQFKLDFGKLKNYCAKSDTIFNCQYTTTMILDILFLVLIPYPFLKDIEIHFYNHVASRPAYYKVLFLSKKVNDIMNLLLLFRTLFIVRISLLVMSSMYDVNCDFNFVLKCIMKEKPLTFVMVSGLFSIVFFGQALRICESPLARPFIQNGNLTKPSGNNFDVYYNSWWNVVITMTTVGYGDYYPRTHLGRIYSVFLSIWGIFIVSLTVVSLTNLLNLDNLENKAFTVLQKLTAKEKLRKISGHLIGHIAYLKIKAKKEEYIKPKEIKFARILLNEFKMKNRYYKSLSDDNLKENIERTFESLDFKVNTLATYMTLNKKCQMILNQKSFNQTKYLTTNLSTADKTTNGTRQNFI